MPAEGYDGAMCLSRTAIATVGYALTFVARIVRRGVRLRAGR